MYVLVGYVPNVQSARLHEASLPFLNPSSSVIDGRYQDYHLYTK